MSTMRNSVLLIGRPKFNPIMNNEEHKASFKLVVPDGSTGCSYTFDCVAMDKVAQKVVQQVKEGRRVAIDGSLRNYDYSDPTGYTHTHTEIVVCDIFLIDMKG